MRVVLAVHGTASPAGQTVYAELAGRVGAHVPTALAHLDVVAPLLPDVARDGDIVVPVLLARGYHVRVDCAVAERCGAVVAPAVGPDPALVRLAQARLRAAGAGDAWPVVLAAAGSRDPRAQRDLATAARRLARLRRAPVELAFASRPGHVRAAVAELRRMHGGPVATGGWLIAPGRFADVTAQSGSDVTAGPLGADEALAGVVLRRVASVSTAHAAWSRLARAAPKTSAERAVPAGSRRERGPTPTPASCRPRIADGRGTLLPVKECVTANRSRGWAEAACQGGCESFSERPIAGR